MWLAGYLEGEGSFCCITSNGYLYLQISVSSNDQDIAEKAAKILEARCHGPYQRGPGALGTSPYWQVSLTGARAADVMNILIPFMGKRRLGQIKKALSSWSERPASQGNSLKAEPAKCHPEEAMYKYGLCRSCHSRRFRWNDQSIQISAQP